MPKQALILGILVDLTIIVSLTVLAALRVIPSEAYLGVIGTLVGARAMRGHGGGGSAGGALGGSSGGSLPPPEPKPGAPVAQQSALAHWSVAAAIVGVVFAFFHVRTDS